LITLNVPKMTPLERSIRSVRSGIATTTSARNFIFCAMRRFAMVSPLSKTHRKGFAVEDFFLDPIFDQKIELLGSRRTLPFGLEQDFQLRKIIKRESNLA